MSELYTCNKCGSNFAKKYDLNRHKNRITDCVSGSKTKKKIKSYHCKYCKKSFNRKDNMNRHMSTCLKKTEIKISKSKNVIVNNGDNNVALNNSNVYINLVIFAKDGVKNISQKDLGDILRSNKNLFESMISNVNFNPEKPEHHNVYCSDLKSAYGVVYENKKWVTKKIDEILDLLLDAKIEDLNEILNEMGVFLNKKTRQRIKETIENADYSKPNCRKKLKMYIKPLLYNNKEMIIKTRKLLEDNDDDYEYTRKKLNKKPKIVLDNSDDDEYA